jgi:hypothetical protein
MEQRCDNCGQPALAGDTVCWHCGWRLTDADEAEGELVAVSARQGWQQPTDLTAIVIYGVLTLAVILLTLLVMGWLGRRPLIEASPAAGQPGRRQVITTADRSFIIDLPDDWVWLDGTNRPQAPLLASLLAEDPWFSTATFPLGEELTDLTINLAAAAPTFSNIETFAIVATSRDLSLLPEESIVRYLRAAEFQNSLVLEVTTSVSSDGSSVNLTAEVMDEVGTDLLHCQQKIVRGAFTGWLVSTCSPSLQYAKHEEVMATIVASFRLLGSY